MKLMKHITIALVICAIPAVAFGQLGVVTDGAKAVVVCPKDTCYAAPYFAGTGGFVAMGSTMVMDSVAVAVSCGNVVETMEFTPDEDGMVREAFNEMNGLACAAGGGSFVIDGIAAGGWYWINDTMSSAVSSLVPLSVYENARITPVDPGGVTVTPAATFSASEPNGVATEYMAGASYVSHEASGRVGIIPHILPTIPDPPADFCGPTLQNNCTVNASYRIGLTLVAGAVTREVGATMTRSEDGTVTPRVVATGNLADGTGGVFTSVVRGSQDNGVTDLGGEILVAGADNDRCAADNIDRDTPIEVTFSYVEGTATGYVPRLVLADLSITVHCPAAGSANQGVNLVPENPFPVE